MQNPYEKISLAVVIPCFKVRQHIMDVIAKIPANINHIFVIDDCCPEKTGDFVKSNCTDHRVQVIYNQKNLGVGGAVMSGYSAAILQNADIIIKIDGDGQMDPALIPEFILPILRNEADYTKGNRFYNLDGVRGMPWIRMVGNSCLSFLSKLSSGYWDLFDPTNGYTAIHARIAERLPFKKISQSYFFESDILFRLNTLRAVVIDIPMESFYGEEISNLLIAKVLPEFLIKNIRNTIKRIFYSYYLRSISIASFELPLGLLALGIGAGFGARSWIHSIESGISTPTGTIMLAVLPIVVGVNLLLSFINYDISSCPQRVMHKRLQRRLFTTKRHDV